MTYDKIRKKNVLHTHELNSVALYFVWTYNNNDLWSYVEIDCATKLLIKLNVLAEHGIEEITKNHKIIMSDEDYDDFDNATCCHISKRKVHHLTKLENKIPWPFNGEISRGSS